MEAIFPSLVAGVVISVIVAARVMQRRRGRGLPPRFWRVLGVAWAIVLVVSVLFALLPRTVSDALIPIVTVVTGAGLVATAIWTRSRHKNPAVATATSRAVVLGLLQLAAGLVLLILFLGRG
jgi:uncharacterized membrane-anchored protein